MPYASPAFRRAQSVQRFVAPSRPATAEIDRVVVLVHRDLSKARQSERSQSDWSSIIAYAKAGEMRRADDWA